MAIETIKVNALNPGDKIRLFNGDSEYCDATVYRKDPDGTCHVWRPYIHTGDVMYSGNRIIPYVGIEDFALWPESTVALLRRGDALR